MSAETNRGRMAGHLSCATAGVGGVALGREYKKRPALVVTTSSLATLIIHKRINNEETIAVRILFFIKYSFTHKDKNPDKIKFL